MESTIDAAATAIVITIPLVSVITLASLYIIPTVPVISALLFSPLRTTVPSSCHSRTRRYGFLLLLVITE
jgi:hypothetical protein